MREKTRMRRIWWFKDWQYEQAEAWLSDLSEQGWQLETVGMKISVFRKCAPERLKYRLVFRSFDMSGEKKKYIEECKQAGWDYVDEHWNLLVFAASGDADEACLQDDPSNHKSYLIKKIWGKVILCAAGLLLSALCYKLIYCNPWLLADYLIKFDLLILYPFALLISFLIYHAVSFIMMFSELKRRKRHKKADPKRPYGKTLAFMRLFGVIFLVLLILGITPFWKNGYEYSQPEDLTPLEGLVFVTVRDIADDAKFELIEGSETPFAGGIEYGLLYSDHIYLFHGVHAYIKDTPGEHQSILLQYHAYRAAIPWMAALLAEQLAGKYDLYGLAEPEDTQGFDRLWLSDWMLIALDGDCVYLVNTYSTIPPQDVVPMLRAKIQGTNKQ